MVTKDQVLEYQNLCKRIGEEIQLFKELKTTNSNKIKYKVIKGKSFIYELFSNIEILYNSLENTLHLREELSFLENITEIDKRIDSFKKSKTILKEIVSSPAHEVKEINLDKKEFIYLLDIIDQRLTNSNRIIKNNSNFIINYGKNISDLRLKLLNKMKEDLSKSENENEAKRLQQIYQNDLQIITSRLTSLFRDFDLNNELIPAILYIRSTLG